MNLDQALQRINQLEKENAAMREHFQAHQRYPTPAGWWVFLDEYEIANLKSVIEAIGYGAPVVHPDDPEPGRLTLLNTGDWVGQIYFKLPPVAHSPNLMPFEYRRRINT